MVPKKQFSIEQISFLAALCMFLSSIEYAIPKPLPFLRLGLANLPILLALKKLRPGEILVLVLLKIFVQALVSGTLFSYILLFSFSGSIASGLVMLIGYWIFYRTGFFSNIGLSLAGAAANCGAQLVCARFLMFGANVRFVAPVLLISSFVTGLALGIFANIFENRSRWYGSFCGKTEADSDNGDRFGKVFHKKSTDLKKEKNFVEKLWKNSVFRLCFSLIFMILLMVVKNLWVQIGIVLLFFVLVLIKRHGKVKWLPSLLILIFVTLFSLCVPFGKVLFSIGTWKITLGALSSGLERSFLLIGMVFISQFMVDKNISLPGKLGFMVESIFLVYDRLVVEKISFKKRNIVEAIDEKLLSLSR